MAAPRERLDVLLVQRGLAPSRQLASALIRAGQVLVNDMVSDKPGTRIRSDAAVRIRGEVLRYVGRGGLKLEGALDTFGVDPTGHTCADFGASTGGFTDCLLQRGAAKVFAIDVGYGQLAWKLRQDPRVVVMERTNARHLTALPEPPSLIVGDLSFISLKLILPAVQQVAASDAEAVLLIKPQFELGPGQAKGGVVKDPVLRQSAITEVCAAAEALGATVLGTVASSLPGAKKGNVEELLHLRL